MSPTEDAPRWRDVPGLLYVLVTEMRECRRAVEDMNKDLGSLLVLSMTETARRAVR